MKQLILATLFLLGACGGKPEAVEPSPPKVEGERIVFSANSPQLATLKSMPVNFESHEILRLNGRTSWDESRTVRVFSPLAGRIVSLTAGPGSRVKRGDPLATISSPDFGQAQAESAKAEADFAMSDKALARARELAEHGVIAGKDLQQTEADLAHARAEVERTRARTRLLGGGANVDQQFVLRAPIAGILVERNANPGQEVRPDQAQPGSPALFVISDPTRLWIQLDVPESSLGGISPGIEFRFKVAATPDSIFIGKIEYVGDSLDPVTRITRARGSVDNLRRLLKAEMFVAAEADVERSPFVLLPASAVLLGGNVRYVFVDEGGGCFVRRPVEGDEAVFGTLRIWKGLQAGERVVVGGSLMLQQILTDNKT